MPVFIDFCPSFAFLHLHTLPADWSSSGSMSSSRPVASWWGEQSWLNASTKVVTKRHFLLRFRQPSCFGMPVRSLFWTIERRWRGCGGLGLKVAICGFDSRLPSPCTALLVRQNVPVFAHNKQRSEGINVLTLDFIVLGRSPNGYYWFMQIIYHQSFCLCGRVINRDGSESYGKHGGPTRFKQRSSPQLDGQTSGYICFPS